MTCQLSVVQCLYLSRMLTATAGIYTAVMNFGWIRGVPKPSQELLHWPYDPWVRPAVLMLGMHVGVLLSSLVLSLPCSFVLDETSMVTSKCDLKSRVSSEVKGRAESEEMAFKSSKSISRWEVM
jgi:hypothetical protein